LEKNLIIAVFSGRKSSAGHDIKISEVIRNKSEQPTFDGLLTVKITRHISAGGMMLPVLTSPFHIVEIPKGKYEFKYLYEDAKE
jgi:hypothetical protein